MTRRRAERAHELLRRDLADAAFHLRFAIVNLQRAQAASPRRPIAGVSSQREFLCSISQIALSLASFDLGLAGEHARTVQL
jgi:hypothetical protein